LKGLITRDHYYLTANVINTVLSPDFISSLMPHPSKSKAQLESEAEDFSDVSSTGSDGSEDKIVEDNWVFPAVENNAKRPDFIQVHFS
jgi:hypothetical protein